MTPEQEHLQRIALPSKVGQYIGQQVFGEPYVMFPFVAHAEQRIIDAIMDTEHERYVIVNAPPQVGKSTYCGILLPFWITGMFPQWQVMYISYSDDFSTARGKDVRTLHNLFGPELFGSRIDPDFTMATDWRVTGGRGGMLSVGVGGLITGRPGHCFPGDTLVSTPDGPQRIDHLAQYGGMVWGYDHAVEEVVPRSIVAGASKGCKSLVEVEFTSGRVVHCTADHPIFVVGVGYVEAGLVEVGSKVRAVRNDALRCVREARDDEGLRVAEEAEDAQRQGVLQRGLRGGRATRRPALRPLQRAAVEEAQVLLTGLSGGQQHRHAPAPLPAVWNGISMEVQPTTVLHAGLRGSGALGADGGERQPALQGRHVVRELVQGDEASHLGEGRGLRYLRSDNFTGGPPHQREGLRQQARQPHYPLQGTPHNAPQVECDAVVMVRPIRGSDVEVYDIQVEGTGNFFAEEVLVHNCIIIDDLIKNAQEAASAATKRTHLAEWDGTINRRVQPGGTVIIIATRWAEDDLSGALIERMKEPGYSGPQWEVIEFPAFAEPQDGVELSDDELLEWHDIIGRKNGEVLDCRFSRIPNRAPEDFFTLARAGMDGFAWSCLYQQKPSAREGGMFPVENWQFYDIAELPEIDKQVRVWDLAATEGGGDWTVGTLMGRSGDKFYVLDVQRFRKSAGGVQDEVKRVAAMDGFSIKIKFEEEKGGSGKSVTEAYKRLLVGHIVEPSKAEGDKESRSTPYSSEQNKKRVFLPRIGTVAWDVKAFIEEHRKMMGDGRRPKHDDQIDTAAYCILDLLGSGVVEMWIPSAGSNWLTAEQQMNVLMERIAI